MINVDSIKVDYDFQTLLEPWPESQCEAMREEILAHGFREPLIVWRNHNILVDGHNRYQLWHDEFSSDPDAPCPDVVEYDFADREEVKAFIIRNQLDFRRNIGPDRAARLRGMLVELRKGKPGSQPGNKKAAKTKVKLGKNKGAGLAPLNGKTSAKVAEETGVSERTARGDAAFYRAVEKLEGWGLLKSREVDSGEARKRGWTKSVITKAGRARSVSGAVIILEDARTTTPPEADPWAAEAAEGDPDPEAGEFIATAETLKGYGRPFRELESIMRELSKRFDALRGSSTYAKHFVDVHQAKDFGVRLENLRNVIRYTKPRAVCCHCAGHGCDECGSSGVLNSHRTEKAQ